MKKLFAGLLLLLTLVGCATTAGYEKMLDGWVGSSELDLVRRWGAPQQTYESSGTKFLQYSSARNVYIPGTAPTYTTNFIGNTAYTNRVGGTPGQNIALGCETTFEVADGKVTSWRWKGNDCKAKE